MGKSVEIAGTQEIFHNALHPYTKALLSAYPIPDPHRRDRKRLIIEGDVPNPAHPPQGCRFHTRCPYAKGVCAQTEPALKGKEHAVACYLYV